MSKRVAVQRALGVAVVVGGIVAGPVVVRAQPAPPCVREANQCPSPMSTQYWIHNNLKPDSNGTCRFEERNITPLDLELDDSVSWTFCNACAVDMEVQLDTSSPGPFNRFQFFRPMPTADNMVSIVVPCHFDDDIYGMSAREGDPDFWKYTLRARQATTLPWLDEIDPDLAIDDSPGLHRHIKDYGVPSGLLVLGLLIGWLVSRRRR
jgi:hypothetical protein